MRTVVSPSPIGPCTEGPPVVSCQYFTLVWVPLMPLFPGSVWHAAKEELDTYYSVSHSLLRHCAQDSVSLRPVALCFCCFGPEGCSLTLCILTDRGRLTMCMLQSEA